MVDDSDLDSVSDKLRLISISDREEEDKNPQVFDFEKSDEEFARMLQVLSRTLLTFWIYLFFLTTY